MVDKLEEAADKAETYQAKSVREQPPYNLDVKPDPEALLRSVGCRETFPGTVEAAPQPDGVVIQDVRVNQDPYKQNPSTTLPDATKPLTTEEEY